MIKTTAIRSIIGAALPPMLLLGLSQAWAEDLVDVYNAAVENDPVYQSQALTLKAEQQGPASARGDLLPNVRLFAAHAERDEEVESGTAFASGQASFGSNEYGVTVTQPLFNSERFLSYQQSKLAAQSAEIDFKDAQQELILRVVDRYLGVLAAQDNLELAIAERRAIHRQLELARSRLEVGLGTTTDLYDAQARFELAQAQEIRAQQSLEDAHQALQELVGHRIEQLDPLQEDSPLTPPTPDNQSLWVNRAESNNLALAAAGINEEISRREVSRQKARRMPTVNLILSHNVADDDGSISGGDVSREATEGRLQLEIPIFQGGGITADSRAAAFRYEAAQQQTESARRSATRSARSTFLDVTTSAREAAALDQAVVASEKALESREEGFEAGLNTNLDVLDAQSDLFQAKRNYLSARYQYITNRLQLYSVAGELDLEDLETVNAWLE